jgi:thymidine kinase
VIGIDEGQFYPDVVEMAEKLTLSGKIVIISALSGTFKMEPFELVSRLISKADKIKHLKAVCNFCPNKAAFSLRTINVDQEVLIGAQDMYLPACKVCYYQNKTNEER